MRSIRHLINTDNLGLDEIKAILSKAKSKSMSNKALENKNIVAIFFENSTRTLSSFEVAIKNLGGKIIRLDVKSSSTSKGESIADTASNLNAMNPHAILIRHKAAGAANFLSKYVSCPIINGGDGAHAHPTQALLDLYTILEHFSQDLDFNILKGKKLAIIGDIKNSRVANSNIRLLGRLGVDISLVAPPHFLNPTNLKTYSSIDSIINQVDIIMALRTQVERHDNQIYGSLKDYANRFCIDIDTLGNKDLILLHPGPVNRNIDITDECLEDKRSKVLKQVENGVLVRMAVMDFFCNIAN